MPLGSPGTFPLPAAGGPRYLYFHQFQQDWSAVTDKHIYEDGGASFVMRNDEGPIRWTIRYDGLSLTEAATLDAHRADAGGEVFGFQLVNPRTSVTYTGVHYDEEYAEDHEKTWINSREIHLIKRPV
jgi:hypothetical protein